MQNSTFIKQVSAQMTAIVLAAAAAAIFTFFQSLAQQSGICEPTLATPGESGLLAAWFKSLHSFAIMAHSRYS